MDLNGTLSPHININSIVAVWCPVWPSCSYQCYIRYLICALSSQGIHTIYYFIWKQKKLKWKYILLTSNKILIKICSEFWKISSQPFYMIHWIGCTLQLFPRFKGSWTLWTQYIWDIFPLIAMHITDHSIVCIRLESLFWAVSDSDQSQLWLRWPGCCGGQYQWPYCARVTDTSGTRDRGTCWHESQVAPLSQWWGQCAWCHQ